MKEMPKPIMTFFGAYFGAIISLWGIVQAYTYFTGDELKARLGPYWLLVFYGFPLLVALVTTLVRQLNREAIQLSREELDKFTRESVDPKPLGPVQRSFHNVGLGDGELRRRIIERNRDRKPTYLLRMEYERRLGQRGG
jgi:hypothetical protein